MHLGKLIANRISLLNRRTIGNRIREGHTQLYNIRTTLLHGQQDWNGIIEGGVASSDEGDEGGDALGPL